MATVLVIEDDPTILANTVELLELEGYKVVAAVDGDEGIQRAQEAIPDLIVCDVLMPKVDGYGVLSYVRGNPSTTHIPLIFVSATPRADMPVESIQLGISDYLTKPFRASDLLRVVRGLLPSPNLG